jgi:hypothetical protein
MPTPRTTPPPEIAALVSRPSTSYLVAVADVCCYMCGESCGAIEARPDQPGVALFRGRQVALRSLRCPRCRGAVYLDQPRTVRRWDDHINWAFDAPRRGRPPQWLVDLRSTDAA